MKNLKIYLDSCCFNRPIFIRQFENGSGNYTEEREETLKGISIDDIVLSIKKKKGPQLKLFRENNA